MKYGAGLSAEIKLGVIDKLLKKKCQLHQMKRHRHVLQGCHKVFKDNQIVWNLFCSILKWK